MHRSVKSNDVMDFSSHMPADDVDIDSEDDIEYNNGVLVASSGTNTVSFMPKVTVVMPKVSFSIYFYRYTYTLCVHIDIAMCD